MNCACIVDVHTVLADLATEQESFEDALSDYKEARQLLAPKLKVRMHWSKVRGSHAQPLCILNRASA